MRLFVAAEIPESWRRSSQRLCDELRTHHGAAVRTVAEDAFHVTLQFLGNVHDEDLPKLQAALDRQVPPVSVHLQLGSPGTFGSASRTRVVWQGIDGDLAALAEVVDRVHAATEHVAPRDDDRPFRPHITLARVSRSATPPQRRGIAEHVASLSVPATDAFTLRAVTLFRSHLGRGGAHYERLSTHG